MNDDLIGALQSETFANDAARLSATHASGGALTSVSGGVASLQIVYLASSDSYVFSAGGRKVTFGPGSVDQGKSDARQTTYVIQSGDQYDELVVTNAGLSGPLTYRYVAGALWLSDQAGSGGASSHRAYAAAFGAQTPAGAVPVTGRASYDIDVFGSISYDNASGIRMSGTGEIQVNFATGTVVTSGDLGDEFGNPIHLDGAAQIVSGQNQFVGNVYLNYQNSPFLGDVSGSFYGPNAQEVGAALYAQDPYGNGATATLIGRRGADQEPNSSFVDATDREFFTVRGDTLAVTYDGGDKAYSGIAAGDEQVVVRFDPADGHYLISTPTTSLLQYSRPVPFAEDYVQLDYDGTWTATLWDFANGDYARAALYGSVATTGDRQKYQFQSFVYGYQTVGTSLPVTGHAGYALSIGAMLVDKAYEDYDWTSSFPAVRLLGDGALFVDFATGQIDLTGSLDATNGLGVAIVDGSATLVSGTSDLNGAMTVTGPDGTDYVGAFDGAFYGPQVQEVAATFTTSAGSDAFVQGFFMGARDDALTHSADPLGSETEATTYPGNVANSRNQLEDGEIIYDPATHTYSFNGGAWTDYAEFALGPDEYDPSRSDDTRQWYAGAFDGVEISGWLSKPGPDNPQVALTYTGFGHFDTSREVTPTAGDPFVDEYGLWMVYGRETPVAAIPRAGQATYSGIALGSGDLDSVAYAGDITGTSTLALDFGENTATATLHLFTAEPAPASLGTYTFSGISGETFNGFHGNLPFPEQQGQFQGNLYGPNAEEFGFAWEISQDNGPNSDRMQGIAVGTKDAPAP